jgi:hypothetical protein
MILKLTAMKNSPSKLKNLLLAMVSVFAMSAISFTATGTTVNPGKSKSEPVKTSALKAANGNMQEVMSYLASKGIKTISVTPGNDGSNSWIARCMDGRIIVMHQACGIIGPMIDIGFHKQ